MKSLLCELLFSCVLAAPGMRGIDELAYGNMLYAYYQADYPAALLEVMVDQKRGRDGGDPARLALAQGSLAFAEGLYRMSDAALAGLEPGTLSEIDRRRLGFHHARAYYRSGDWGSMTAALDGAGFAQSASRAAPYAPEVAFMRAEAAIAAGNFSAAEAALQPLPPSEEFLGYGLFNLAVAHRAAGDLGAARSDLARLADLPLESLAGRDLIDRGRLALAKTAYEAAAEGAPEPLDATQVLDHLPGQSRYRDQALAVYGHLAMQRQDYRLAARIWLTLQKNPDWQEAHAAAALGLPMALEAMDAPGAALDGYRRAADVFDARLTGLQTLSGRTREPAWAGHLVATATAPRRGQAELAMPDAAEAFGSAAWLTWLAREDVNGMLDEWRTLDHMRAWLEALPEQLEALEQVKVERARRGAAAHTALGDRALTTRRDELLGRIQQLEPRIALLGGSAQDFDNDLLAALAGPEERALLQRIDRLAAALPVGTAAPEQQARIARLRGIVTWRIAETRSARVRTLVNELAQARELLAGVDVRIARLSRAEAELAAGAAADFAELSARSATLTAAVEAALDGREQAVAAAFRDALDTEIARTGEHLMTARVAVARTTDQLAANTHPQRPES